MKAKTVLLTICILIFLTGLMGSLWLICRPHSQTVQIIQDGIVLYTIDLERAENQMIEIAYQESKNIIQINNHKISIIEAECPDQTCVKMGELKSSAAPIVCLPNKLVVKFAETNDIDAEVK